jgi:hypothetical protein
MVKRASRPAGFFLMAFDQNGTSTVPAIQQAELVDRSKEL